MNHQFVQSQLVCPFCAESSHRKFAAAHFRLNAAYKTTDKLPKACIQKPAFYTSGISTVATQILNGSFPKETFEEYEKAWNDWLMDGTKYKKDCTVSYLFTHQNFLDMCS